ncbi:hypothetical protein M2427_004169 [Bradyrhizobium sp. BR13661]|jgi:hypothetical protein|nr:hypothetical protein [Bradyrhizobium sp. BR13661]
MEMGPTGAANRGSATPAYDNLIHLTKMER